MALQNLTPPEDVKQALRDNIKDYLDSNDPMIKPLLESNFAIPILSLRVDGLEELNNEELKPTAWRFMARAVSGAPIAADVAIGPPPRIISLSRDKVLADLESAIRKHEQTVAPSDRILVRIPEVMTDALWVRTEGEINIAPIRTQAEDLLQEEIYPNETFQDKIRTLAEEFNKPNSPGDEPNTSSIYKSLRK